MSLTQAELLDDVGKRLFAPALSQHPHAIGLELELIPLHRSSHARALATEGERVSTATCSHGLARAWLG